MNENIILSREELKALKIYYRSPHTAVRNIDSLLELSLIQRESKYSVLSDDDPRIVYRITPSGRQCYLYNRKNNLRYYITTIIAAIALVKSFFPELVSLWKLLTQ